jgi:hypothetical protein
LTKKEINPVSSIACLKAKQQDPAVNCSDGMAYTLSSGFSSWSGELNAGHFPSYKDAACNSDGAFLCDPELVLNDTERAVVAAQLAELREEKPVTCGHLLGGVRNHEDPHGPGKSAQLHVQPFYLGVVIVSNWPVSQSHPEYLQQLGQTLSAEWGMNELYVGSSNPYARCPSTGMLIILPQIHEAYLSTPSCEFICPSRGGEDVVSATIASLRAEGTAAAAATGIREVYKFLGAVPEASAQSANVAQKNEDNANAEGSVAISFHLAMLVATVFLFIGSFAAGGFMLLTMSGLVKRSRDK